MKIESYGPVFTDIATQRTITDASQTGRQSGTHDAPALDKTTLSAGAAGTPDKTTLSSGALASAGKAVAAAHTAPSGDKTTLSSTSTAAQSLTQAALQTATSRAAKVENLKQAVSSAQYKLDTAKIAQALSDGGF